MSELHDDETIGDFFGNLGPYLPSVGGYGEVPLWVIHDEERGWWVIDIGTYQFSGEDVDKLRAAIDMYDYAARRG